MTHLFLIHHNIMFYILAKRMRKHAEALNKGELRCVASDIGARKQNSMVTRTQDSPRGFRYANVTDNSSSAAFNLGP